MSNIEQRAEFSLAVASIDWDNVALTELLNHGLFNLPPDKLAALREACNDLDMAVQSRRAEDVAELKELIHDFLTLLQVKGQLLTAKWQIPEHAITQGRISPQRDGTVRGTEEQVSVLLSSEKVAELLGCSPRHVKRLTERKLFPQPIRMGRLVKWRRSDLDEYLRRNGKKR